MTVLRWFLKAHNIFKNTISNKQIVADYCNQEVKEYAL
jgi:hypothetical protein